MLSVPRAETTLPTSCLPAGSDVLHISGKLEKLLALNRLGGLG